MSRVELEPPATAADGDHPRYIVGRDPHGWWLAIEIHKLGGGLFKSREDALHYVEFETGHRRDAVELASAPLQLEF